MYNGYEFIISSNKLILRLLYIADSFTLQYITFLIIQVVYDQTERSLEERNLYSREFINL